jgi:hypothetical protein
MEEIRTTNRRVVDFYRRNPHLDFDALNVTMVDLLERLGDDMGRVVQSTVHGQLMEEMREVRRQVADLREGIGPKVADANKAFLETVRMLLSISASEGAEKVSGLLATHIECFGDRLQVLFPKMTEAAGRKMDEQLALLQRSLQLDLQKATGEGADAARVLESLDRRLGALQQPLFALVQAGHDGVGAKVGALQEEVRAAHTAQDRLHSGLSDFLQKYAASPQLKGRVGEDRIADVLCELFPTAEVRNTTGQTAHGDFLLVRPGKPRVMLEVKQYGRNVDTCEVDKFIRDATQQKCSAIMLSQFSGIVAKPNFFVEIADGCVLVYLHNVQSNPRDLVRVAVDIVDHLSLRLAEEDGGVALSKEMLETISAELQQFAKKKDAITALVREQHRTLMAQVDDLTLPGIFQLIGYTTPETQSYVCAECAAPFATKRGLATHRRTHLK